jgi:hypothetical protein
MTAPTWRRLAPALLAALCCLATPGHATSVRPMNVLDLINNSATIVAGRVEEVTEGFASNGMPYTEVTLRVLDRFRGAQGDHYTFRQFGLSRPRTLSNGKVYLGGRPEGWPTWKVGEVSMLFLYQPARITGFQTTVGLGYGKLGVGNGVVLNAYDNVGLFQNAQLDRSRLTANEKKMFDAKNGPVDADTFRSFVRRAVRGDLTKGISDAAR